MIVEKESKMFLPLLARITVWGALNHLSESLTIIWSLD